MTQHEQILELLKDGNAHCVSEILEKMFIVDYRRRMCDLKEKGYNLISKPCAGSCGKRHTSNLHEWRLVKEVKQEVLF